MGECFLSLQKKPTNPLVSVVIVNHNGVKWLPGCLSSLANQHYRNIEVLLVDNASTDKSVHYVRDTFPDVRIIELPQNAGFAEGNNIGTAAANGEYLFLLNNDTVITPQSITTLVEALESLPKVAIVQPKIKLLEEKHLLDTCGAYWTNTTALYYWGNSKDAEDPLYQRATPFFSIKGAAMMLRKNALASDYLFDATFWCYYEETDLCHRLWTQGAESWYIPDAIIYHHNGGTSLKLPRATIEFHNIKNKFRSFLKNFEARSLPAVLFLFSLLYSVTTLAWVLRGKPGLFLAFPKAVLWNIGKLPETLALRKDVQAKRTLSDQAIFAMVKKNPRWGYYWKLFTGKLETYTDTN